jgi:3-dehydroquinate synthase
VNAANIRVRSASRRTEYPIVIEEHLAASLATHLERVAPGARPILVSSPRVWRHHGSAIAAGLGRRNGREPEVVLVPDGERAKHLTSVSRLYDRLLDLKADRRTVVVVVGGGVLGDLAGFAAASFLRGLPVVQVPTTVVAQVDSAIGGKVGVNHTRGKNLIGAFHPPLAVLTDPLLLATLPARELRAGLYEVVKYGMISSARLFARLERDLPRILACEAEALRPVVAECSRIKARVVSIDEHETGLRRILNFGHTVGHALEAITTYTRFLHGEAVGWGMLAAARLARTRGELSSDAFERLARLVDRVGPRPPVNDLSIEACVSATARDKKVVAGTLHFVLPVAIGRTRIATDVTMRELTRALRTLGMRP